MKSKKYASYMAVAVAILMTLMLSSAVNAQKKDKVLKIGALGDWSGEGAGTGELFKQGIQLRLDEAGWEVAGRKIELVMEDSGSKVEMSMDKIRKMVEVDGIEVNFGPMLPYMIAAVRSYLEPKKIIVMTYFQAPYALARQKNIITNQGASEAAYNSVGWYAAEDLHYRTMVTMTPDFAAGHALIGGVEDAFKQKGGTVLKRFPIPFGTMDFGPYLASAAQNKPDCVAAFFMEPVVALRFFQQYRAYGLEKTPVMTIGGDAIEPILSDLGDYCVGMVTGVPYSATLDNPLNSKFVSAFEKKYSKKPINYNATAYVTTSAFLEAVKATGGDTTFEKLYPAITNLKLNTPRGPHEFTSWGCGLLNQYIMKVVKVKEGQYQWKYVKTYPKVGVPLFQ